MTVYIPDLFLGYAAGFLSCLFVLYGIGHAMSRKGGPK